MHVASSMFSIHLLLHLMETALQPVKLPAVNNGPHGSFPLPLIHRE